MHSLSTMMMYRRYFWLSRILPLAVVAAGVVALIPSDFRAAAVLSASPLPASAQPAPTKVSMPAPKLLALAELPAAVTSPAPDPITAAASSIEIPAAQTPDAASMPDAPSQAPDSGLAELRDARIGASGVNVRAGSSKDFSVLFTLAPDSAVRARETINGWVHVYSDQGDGWIYSSYLVDNSDGSGQAVATAASSSPYESLMGRSIRLKSDAQVYDNPGGSPIYVLDGGERVRVAEAQDNWIRIVTDTDESGWLRLH